MIGVVSVLVWHMTVGVKYIGPALLVGPIHRINTVGGTITHLSTQIRREENSLIHPQHFNCFILCVLIAWIFLVSISYGPSLVVDHHLNKIILVVSFFQMKFGFRYLEQA
jgi:hypothetical protein